MESDLLGVRDALARPPAVEELSRVRRRGELRGIWRSSDPGQSLVFTWQSMTSVALTAIRSRAPSEPAARVTR